MKTILLLEDDAALGCGIQLALQSPEVTIRLCSTLVQTQEELAQHEFDLLILKVSKPTFQPVPPVKRFLDISPKNFEPLRRLSSWAAGLGIFPGCAAAPGLGWAAGQFLPPEGDLHPRQAGAGECRKYRKNKKVLSIQDTSWQDKTLMIVWSKDRRYLYESKRTCKEPDG